MLFEINDVWLWDIPQRTIHRYKWRIGVYMYIVVVQITRTYLETPCCIVFPIQEGKGSLSSYLTADSSMRTMANSTWIEMHPLPTILMHRRMANCWSHWRCRAGQRGRERERDLQILDASTFSSSDFFPRASR